MEIIGKTDEDYLAEVKEKFDECTNGLLALRERIEDMINVFDDEDIRDEVLMYRDFINNMMETLL